METKHFLMDGKQADPAQDPLIEMTVQALQEHDKEIIENTPFENEFFWAELEFRLDEEQRWKKFFRFRLNELNVWYIILIILPFLFWFVAISRLFF